MKKFILNSVLLFLLIIFPLLPGYLRLYNQKSNPQLKLCIQKDVNKSMNILKGDLAYLEAILSRALENNKNEMPTSQELNNTFNLLVYTTPTTKINILSSLIVTNKLFFSMENNFSTVYLKIPSPPPKVFSYYYL